MFEHEKKLIRVPRPENSEVLFLVSGLDTIKGHDLPRGETVYMVPKSAEVQQHPIE